MRGINFHPHETIFVSGGDDSKIKVWNYKTKQCMFTLVGHTDYIRTTFFHPKMPWIVSASDDQTVRIWDYDNRKLVADLVGHNHWVMCAAFHPTDMYVASASLDMTVRVWNIASLRKKQSANAIQTIAMQMLTLPQSIIASSVIGYGHAKGLNWVTWHPDEPRTLVTTSDDQTVRVWRHSTVKDGMLFPVATLQGHSHNVTCAKYVNKNMILSTGEDGAVRFYDAKKKTLIDDRKLDGRVWVAAAHPSRNLIAVGHDSGMTIFSTTRERPAHRATPDGATVLYVQHQKLMTRQLDAPDAESTVVSELPKTLAPADAFGAGRLPVYPNEMGTLGGDAFPMVLNYRGGRGYTFDLHIAPNVAATGLQAGSAATLLAKPHGRSPGRIALVDRKDSQLVRIHEFSSTHGLVKEAVQTIKLPNAAKRLLAGATDEIVIVYDDCVELRDTRDLSHIFTLPVSGVRRVTWTPDFELAAIETKNSITVADKQLRVVCTARDHIRVKGACWSCPVGNSRSNTAPDRQRVLIYVTLTHVKYLLLDGEVGVLTSINRPVYPVAMVGSKFWYIDRHHHLHSLALDTTIMAFQFAILEKRRDDVLVFAKKCLAVETGTSIVSYLYRKGHPDIALAFARTPMVKFPFAIESKDLQTATSVADDLRTKTAYIQLAGLATELGAPETAASALTKAGKSPLFVRTVAGAVQTDEADPLSVIVGDGDIAAMLEARGMATLAAACRLTRGESVAEGSVDKEALDRVKTYVDSIDSESLPRLPVHVTVDQAMTPLPSAMPRPSFLDTLGGVTAAAAPTDGDDWGDDLDDLGLSDDESVTQPSTRPVPQPAAPRPAPKDDWGDDLDDLDLSDDDAMGGMEGPTPTKAPHPFAANTHEYDAQQLISTGNMQAAASLLPQPGQLNYTELRSVIRMAAVSSSVYLPGGVPLPLMDPINRTKAIPRVPMTADSLEESFGSVLAEVSSIGNNENGVAMLEDCITTLQALVGSTTLISADEDLIPKVCRLMQFCRLDILRRESVVDKTAPVEARARYLTAVTLEALFLFQGREASPLTIPIMKMARNAHVKFGNYPYALAFADHISTLGEDDGIGRKVRQKAMKEGNPPPAVPLPLFDDAGNLHLSVFFNGADPLSPFLMGRETRRQCLACGVQLSAAYTGVCPLCNLGVTPSE